MNVATARLNKLQIGAAAAAVAAAATLSPVVAQAQPATMPSLPASPITDMFGTDPILGPITISADNPFTWITNPVDKQRTAITTRVPSGGTTIFEFTPLAFVPGFAKPAVGWFLNLVPQFNVCVGGLGVSVGGYATLKVKSGAC